MIRKVADFLEAWKTLNSGTDKVLAALTDESLKQKVTPLDRTLGRIAWHIIVSIPEMASRTGLKLSGPDENAPVPKSAREIHEAYRTAAASLADLVGKNWTDAGLEIEDNMYGQVWKRGFTLKVIIDHEIHHRGQMTVLMRQAGLNVPGTVGPSREEWSAFGMKPPEL